MVTDSVYYRYTDSSGKADVKFTMPAGMALLPMKRKCSGTTTVARRWRTSTVQNIFWDKKQQYMLIMRITFLGGS
ncbi:hypothetical protein [Paenibacillus humicus]|uniref:hypothetical protein n=1 Tax=Paenibacillus humicus TaxID=412861 RepID=UPI000FDC1A9D|nr:hypothetical protein [Paenibacillus humicus]